MMTMMTIPNVDFKVENGTMLTMVENRSNHRLKRKEGREETNGTPLPDDDANEYTYINAYGF